MEQHGIEVEVVRAIDHDEDTTNPLEHHLTLRPGCETHLDQMKETASVLGEIPVETLSEEMQAKLLVAFREFPCTRCSDSARASLAVFTNGQIGADNTQRQG